MPVNPKQFHTQLARSLPPVALIAGDEPLLVQEAADAWRAQAREAGFDEREVLYLEPGFDWGRLAEAAANLSLFADKRRIELHMGDKGPGKEGSEAMVAFATQPPQDVVLLVTAGPLDKSARSAKWFKTLDSAGLVMLAWPVRGEDYPRWIAERLRAADLKVAPDVVPWLAARTEGNLLACQQEIDKLLLLAGNSVLDVETAEQLVADHAHFEAFDYVDKLLAGEAAGALRSLQRLREEGEEALAILGSLNWALHGLEQMATAMARGGSLEPVFKDARIWGNKQAVFRAAVQRLGLARIRHALRLSLAVDLAVKGQSPDSPWEELVKLTACVAGMPMPVPVNED